MTTTNNDDPPSDVPLEEDVPSQEIPVAPPLPAPVPPPPPPPPPAPVAVEPNPPQRRGDSTIWMVAAVGVPLIGVWLFLASVIIWTAAKDEKILGSIEGLLTGLAVLTIPATQFIQGVLRKWNGSD